MALNRYAAIDSDALSGMIYPFLDGKPDPKGHPVRPNKALVGNVEHALRAIAMLDVERVPCWIGPGPHPFPAEKIIACRNGLLHYPTMTFLPPTPAFFNLNATEFDFDPDAPLPRSWFAFLKSLELDAEAIRLLQEWMGLLLTSNTRYQKILLILGPKRGGKGTMVQVIQGLVGLASMTAPSLADLGESFGLQPLIDKLVAVISDARLSMRADLPAVTENLLRISGEDSISVRRKYLSDWCGRLLTRFIIVSNEVPALADSGGALASRFLILRLTKSFYGHEDLGLLNRLLDELPGIFLWALKGLRRLEARGHFVQPESAKETFRQLEEATSPVVTFVRDECELVDTGRVPCALLFERYTTWCHDANISRVGTVQTFGRALGAAVPGLRTVSLRVGDRRVRTYAGIRLTRGGE